MKIFRLVVPGLVCACLLLQAEAQITPLEVLQRSATALSTSDSIHFTRQYSYRIPHADVVTKFSENFYLKNQSNGICLTRYESTGNSPFGDITSVMIKNTEGTWDLNPDRAIEVSPLYGDSDYVNPFQHLQAVSHLPYALTLAETDSGVEQFYVVKGHLPQQPADSSNPVNFSYKISKANWLVYAVHEEFPQGQVFNMELKKIDQNTPMDPELFDLPPDRTKFFAKNKMEYAQFKKQALDGIFSKKLNELHVKRDPVPKNTRPFVFALLMVVAIAPPAIYLISLRNKTAKNNNVVQ